MPDPGCELSAALLALVQTIDVPLVEVQALRSTGYPGYRPSAFYLRFADGRVLKGREVGNLERAAAVDYVSQHVQHPSFPKVLVRSGRALLTEWAEGRSLEAADWTPEILRQCGAVLGFLHSVPVPDGSPHQRRITIDEWHAKCHGDTAELVRAGVLEPDEARQAVALAMHHAPRTCPVSFVHRDFCAENLVLRPTGEICVVDCETLGIDACDFDLGRTWYRWPMTEPQWQVFLAGYDSHRSAHEFVVHDVYWTIVALVDAALFRLTRETSATAVPIARLRSLLGEPDRATPETPPPPC